MTGGGRVPSRRSPGHPDQYTIWAKHAAVKRWLPIRTGLDKETADADLAARRKIIRANSEPCRLVLLEADARPPT